MFLGDYLAMSASVGVFYFPLISQIITDLNNIFPSVGGIYFPLISQIITDLNNIFPSVPSVGVISPSFTLYTLHLTPLSVLSVGNISIRCFQRSTSSHMQELRYHSSEGVLLFVVDIRLQQFGFCRTWNDIIVSDGSGDEA